MSEVDKMALAAAKKQNESFVKAAKAAEKAAKPKAKPKAKKEEEVEE